MQTTSLSRAPRVRKLIPFLLLIAATGLQAQSLPAELHFSENGRQLQAGGTPVTGFYALDEVHTLQLWFEQANYWTLLTQNYTAGIDVPATLIIDGDTLPAKVGVRFRGQTSYMGVQNSQKKSFNISLDYEDPEQDYEGYETFNLLNGFDDATFMREVVYHEYCRTHIPSVKTNFSRLYINGQDWGLYPNTQQLNGDFLKEWFPSNNGTLWRALKTTGTSGGPGGGGTGGPFGTGYCSLNYLNTLDSTEYKKYYTLKRTEQTEPWGALINVCDKIANTPIANWEEELNKIMDVDRSLWELAYENAFADDDGYINKGGMDYYLYYEPETGRLTLQEYDANSVMLTSHAQWSPFYNGTDTRFAFMYKVFQVPALRQRYLAHLRTIIRDNMQADDIALIDEIAAQIGPLVQADPKKLYSYAQFTAGVTTLKSFMTTRRNYLLANAEVAAADPVFTSESRSVNGVAEALPKPDQSVQVSVTLAQTPAVQSVTLYYATGITGQFSKLNMYDDGQHNDGAANDGTWGAEIPAYPLETYVRYYFEAVAATTAQTRSYLPAGAEHDVFVYRVQAEVLSASVVAINEFMASNTNTVTDQDGEYEDWIELYNTSASSFDLSGWFLSDNPDNLQKYELPAGTSIAGNGYLIVWADEDGTQVGLHANFKLSASGEVVYLVDPSGAIAQEVSFGQQESDKSYSRIPNGTGNFVIKSATFNFNNEAMSPTNDPDDSSVIVQIRPNPAKSSVLITSSDDSETRLQVFDLLGRPIFSNTFVKQTNLDIEAWPAGAYQVIVGSETARLIKL
ncbi:MAG: CotH kinase family protein [Chitinophagales bacterium]|nr:CotH kinase family protein [Chitinophagales bacterium]